MNHELERIWKGAVGASRTVAKIRRTADRRQHGTATFWWILFLLRGCYWVLC